MKKSKKKILVVLIIFIALSIGAYTINRSFFYFPVDEIAPTPALAKIVADRPSTSPYPIELTIPSLNIKAKFQDVGITRKGNMATPNNFTDVGWYKYGPLPGEQGSAIVAGHVDNGLGLPGVFSNLKNIVVGDDIYVQTKNNTQIHFIVTSMAIYDFNASTGDIFTQNDGKFLKLITCSGTWMPELRTHDKRLVVTAEEVLN